MERQPVHDELRMTTATACGRDAPGAPQANAKQKPGGAPPRLPGDNAMLPFTLHVGRCRRSQILVKFKLGSLGRELGGPS